MTALIDIRDLSVSYGHVEAVTGLTLSVAEGEIVTVIGANGAGKSTLLNAAMGLLPASGSIRFRGADVMAVEAEDRVGLGLCLVAEKRELFATMSVEDNLVLGGFRVARAEAARTLEEVFGRFPRLMERRKQLAGTLSGGERQMLAMGRALMSRPKLLMLDEPSLGLAPKIVADIFAIIADLRASGTSILLVEQNARAALAAADRAYVMELGRISLEGRAADLAKDPRIAESYLGLGG
jgi:branched-chain amino acid transport system ATP-binding protein